VAGEHAPSYHYQRSRSCQRYEMKEYPDAREPALLAPGVELTTICADCPPWGSSLPGADERTNGSRCLSRMVTCAKVCSSQQIKIAMGAPSVALAMVEFDGDMEFMLAS